MRCCAVTSDGDPCQQFAMKGSRFCYAHSPEKAEEREKSLKKASKAVGTRIRTADPDTVPRRPETIEDAIEWASWAVWAVATGEIDARTAHETGYVLRAFLDGRKHVDSVDARVKELSAKLAKLRDAS